jgi:hypothetical protein
LEQEIFVGEQASAARLIQHQSATFAKAPCVPKSS